MNQWRVIGAVAMSVVSLGVAGAQASAVAEQEMAPLRGSFTMVSGQADGQPMPPAMTTAMKRISQGHETTVTMAGQLYMKANFTINAAASPKTIDYAMTGGFTAGKTQLGIYRASGDSVTFCFGSPEKPRPTEFVSKPGSGVTCSVWRRDKPAGTK